MTSPRIIVAGATTAVTRRTTLRKAFLAPWDPLVQQCWLYAIADAQRHTDVDVHFGICVVNHHHLCVTPNSDNLPKFTRRVHRDVSASLNTLLAAHRYDAPRELFDGRVPHYQRLCDASAQAARLVYDANNCVAAGLVDRREHMPGRIFDFEAWQRGYIDVQRPELYFEPDDEVRPAAIRLRVTPPPLLFEAFGGDMERLVYHMNRLAEDAGRMTRQARRRPAMGARAVRRLHPWSEPRSLRERGGARIPSFSVGARSVVGWQTHIEAAIETREFRQRHEEARKARLAAPATRFPFGTYEMRVQHGAPVEPEETTAIVARPGPTLDAVRRRLTDEQRAGPEAPVPVDLVEGVRGAFAESASDLCERERFEASEQPESAAAPPDHDADAPPDDDADSRADSGRVRAPASTRHRFGRRTPAEQAGPAAAARVVVLRDRRRGRPPDALKPA